MLRDRVTQGGNKYNPVLWKLESSDKIILM